ncbi:NudC domain-containing protein 1 [Toxocara canis]|uniref:NudC domain-containing protein 1 n=1 Tax=Toxocara canis TaxID=6265 RepID=A0A0B2VIQ3_TOXCA|nr:NudC domain-containing protein 1 [Toxocara canis]
MDVEMPSVVDNLIDLKPDSILLDANFDGYKLSLDHFPCFNIHLPSAVRVLQTTNAQYGLEHVKLFSDLNYLVFDPHSSNNVTKRFYTIVDDLRVCCITFDVQVSNVKEKKFTSVEEVSTITLPTDLNNCEERYPATISFPDPEIAIIANGYEGEGWRMGRAREVTCEGHFEMATFDSTVSDLIVVSCGDTTFTADSARSISKSHATPLVENDSGQIVEEPMEENKKAYVWMQDGEDVTAVFNVAENIRKSDVSMSLSGTSIRLAIKGTLLIEGRLGSAVDASASTYTLDKNKLELSLSKTSKSKWAELVVGDQRGAYQGNREALMAAAGFLERFTADNDTLDEPGTRKSFNTEQLEDCDMSMEEICKIRWLCGETHVTKYMSDITGHHVLFAVALGVEPQCLCLRMDVDGILWALDSQEGKLATHRATFSAFGYVQASKTQRKFCTCSPDCSYAVIVEGKQHAFVYWQPAAVTTDLRHRGTCRRIAAIAKQNLISLSKTDDSTGDKAAISDDIVGVYADDRVLFILTTADLFAFALK